MFVCYMYIVYGCVYMCISVCHCASEWWIQVYKCMYMYQYRIAGNFRGLQFSWMWGFEVFRVLIFKDGR